MDFFTVGTIGNLGGWGGGWVFKKILRLYFENVSLFCVLQQEYIRTVIRMPDLHKGDSEASAQLAVTSLAHSISFFANMHPTTDWYVKPFFQILRKMVKLFVDQWKN